MQSEFSRAIHQLRLERKLSQRRVSQELGISQALLSHYENGVRQPKLAFVSKIAGYYGVSADDLLGCALGSERRSLKCELLLLAELSDMIALAVTAGGEATANLAAQYITAAVANARLIIENPNGAYDPQLYIDIKTAEAALYRAVRGGGEAE
jgi:transcriptional regulator with XRE-family HTH domain